MDEDSLCLIALAACVLLLQYQIRHLRKDVEFAVVIAEKRMTDV